MHDSPCTIQYNYSYYTPCSYTMLIHYTMYTIRHTYTLYTMHNTQTHIPKTIYLNFTHHIIRITLYKVRILRRIGAASALVKEGMGMEVVIAAAELNANVRCSGVLATAKRDLVLGALFPLLATLKATPQHAEIESTVVVELLQAIHRCVLSTIGCRCLLTDVGASECLESLLAHPSRHQAVLYWTLRVIRELVASSNQPTRDREQECVNKRELFLRGKFPSLLVGLLLPLKHRPAVGPLVTMVLVGTIESVLVSHSDTTPRDCFNALLLEVARQFDRVLDLLRSKCAVTLQYTALILKAIVEESEPEVAQVLQIAAIGQGLLLRHLSLAIFSHTADQRYLSRYLVRIWTFANDDAHALLRRILPEGMIHFLSAPAVTMEQEETWEQMEQAQFHRSSLSTNGEPDAAEAGAAAPTTASCSGSRLRDRLRQQAGLTAVPPPVAAAAAAAAAAKKVPVKTVTAVTAVVTGSGKEPSAADTLTDTQATANTKKAAATKTKAAKAKAAKIRSAKGNRAPLAIGSTMGENFVALFHALSLDHYEPDLLWQQETRAELRAVLDTALRELELERQRNGGAVSWNHREFRVAYASLQREYRVGKYYLRQLVLPRGQKHLDGLGILRAGELSAMHESSSPEPRDYFMLLYTSFLREQSKRERGDSERMSVCLQCMVLVCQRYANQIGTFGDCVQLVDLLVTVSDHAVQGRLVQLIDTLTNEGPGDANVELILEDERATAEIVTGLLQLASAAHVAAVQKPAGMGCGGANLGAPALWFYSTAPGVGAPAADSGQVQGPVRVAELGRLMQEEVISADSLVRVAGCSPEHPLYGWRAMRKVPQLHQAMVMTGKPVMPAADQALLCVRLLRRLCTMHASHDARGFMLHPLPCAKRVMADSRRLPSLAQLLLLQEPEAFEQSVSLLGEAVCHASVGLHTLYRTGAFFFVLRYSGSNFTAASRFLKATHLAQAHWGTNIASVTGHLPLRQRSVLGDMLPESLLSILEEKGAQAFAETFTSDSDSPDIIWTHDMRQHLVQMMLQHLQGISEAAESAGHDGADSSQYGGVDRLSEHTGWEYEYCPVPPLSYERLNDELWCHRYYLRNLCDEIRFPDWPIKEPVQLLRAILQSWQEELQKKAPEISLDDALKVLGLQAGVGATGQSIRKAYRKMAVKYHPDKNPDGGPMFQKVIEAYELLSAAPDGTPTPGKAGESGTNPRRVELLIHTQLILFRRCEAALHPYKYAGYPLLLRVLELSAEECRGINAADAHKDPIGTGVEPQRQRLVALAVDLLERTCAVAALNAEELVRCEGAQALVQLLGCCRRAATSGDNGVDVNEKGCMSKSVALAVKVLSVMTHLAKTASGRKALLEASGGAKSMSLMAVLVCRCLTAPTAHLLTQHALLLIIRLSSAEAWQEQLLHAGCLLYLVPLLFEYDLTSEPIVGAGSIGNAPQQAATEVPLSQALALANASSLDGANAGANQEQEPPQPDEDDEYAEVLPAKKGSMQASKNLTAKMTARAIASIAGVAFASPFNELMNGILRTLFPAAIAEQFAGTCAASTTKQLLHDLNSDVITPGVLWTADTRKALTAFAQEQLKTLEDVVGAEGCSVGERRDFIASNTLPRLQAYKCSAMSSELRLGGTFVRIYIEQPDTLEPGMVGSFCGALLDFLDMAKAQAAEGATPLSTSRRSMVLQAFALLVCSGDGERRKAISETIVHRGGLGMLFGYLDMQLGTVPSTEDRQTVLKAALALSPSKVIADVIAESGDLWKLLLLMLRLDDAFEEIMQILLALCATASIAEVVLKTGGVLVLLSLFVGVDTTELHLGPSSTPRPMSARLTRARPKATQVLSRLVWEPSVGTSIFCQICKFLPEAVGLAIKEDEEGALTLFETDHETPELIWSKKTRSELKEALQQALKRYAEQGYGTNWTDSSSIVFKTLRSELCVGGVYVRLFLQEPGFALR
jgi:DnaJ family protein C protein 13